MINLCTVKACIVEYVSVKLNGNKIKIYWRKDIGSTKSHVNSVFKNNILLLS